MSVIINTRPQYFGAELGQLTIYQDDTSTVLANVYSDEARTIQLDNPVRLDSDGRAPTMYTEDKCWVSVQRFTGFDEEGKPTFSQIYAFWSPILGGSGEIVTLPAVYVPTRAGVASADKDSVVWVTQEGELHAYVFVEGSTANDGIANILSSDGTGSFRWDTNEVTLPQCGCFPQPDDTQTDYTAQFRQAFTLGKDVRAIPYNGYSNYMIVGSAFQVNFSKTFKIDNGVTFTFMGDSKNFNSSGLIEAYGPIISSIYDNKSMTWSFNNPLQSFRSDWLTAGGDTCDVIARNMDTYQASTGNVTVGTVKHLEAINHASAAVPVYSPTYLGSIGSIDAEVLVNADPQYLDNFLRVTTTVKAYTNITLTTTDTNTIILPVLDLSGTSVNFTWNASGPVSIGTIINPAKFATTTAGSFDIDSEGLDVANLSPTKDVIYGIFKGSVVGKTFTLSEQLTLDAGCNIDSCTFIDHSVVHQAGDLSKCDLSQTSYILGQGNLNGAKIRDCIGDVAYVQAIGGFTLNGACGWFDSSFDSVTLSNWETWYQDEAQTANPANQGNKFTMGTGGSWSLMNVRIAGKRFDMAPGNALTLRQDVFLSGKKAAQLNYFDPTLQGVMPVQGSILTYAQGTSIQTPYLNSASPYYVNLYEICNSLATGYALQGALAGPSESSQNDIAQGAVIGAITKNY